LFREIDSAQVHELKQAEGQDMLIYGSASIVQQLTNLGLIDEYQLLFYPVLLGGGKQLFAGITAKHPLKLIGTRDIGSGVVLMTYQA
jgi:dihydrofolate reductase